jgi:hypothetical protein
MFHNSIKTRSIDTSEDRFEIIELPTALEATNLSKLVRTGLLFGNRKDCNKNFILTLCDAVVL